MLKHEHYEELCAAASVGQAAPEELADLERHAAECEACRQAYADYLSLAGQHFALADNGTTLSGRDAQRCLDSELFTRRFFDRAEREGIVFSAQVGRDVGKVSFAPVSLVRRSWWRTPEAAIAAAALLGLLVSAGFYGRVASDRNRSMLTRQTSESAGHGSSQRVRDGEIAELRSANQELHVQIDRLTSELSKTKNEWLTAESDRKSMLEDRRQLASSRDQLEMELENSRRELANSEAAALGAEQQSAKTSDRTRDLEETLVADQVKIRELTDELGEKSAALDQERQLLALGHDVNDLMGARNLHIVDVVDTDPKGKTRPAFGRIFFTEGKSLVFYAYDLNDAKIQKANYQYRVWAKQEGGDKRARSLGIFYSDDKTQRRWVFKCNDPKVLREIDSVFVTLEPGDTGGVDPKGPNLMYAYLRGQPNHP